MNVYAKFESAVRQLVTSDRFYAAMVQNCRRVFKDDMPSMGVSQGTAITLYVGNDFVRDNDVDFLAIVLKHEMMHLLAGHLTRVKKYPDYKLNHKFYNVCLDLAVNSAIGFPDTHNGMSFATVANMAKQGIIVAPCRPAEYYVDMLREHTEAAGACDDSDSHEGFGDSENIPDAVREGALRHAVAQAAKAAGSVPGELKALVDELLNRVSPNNWRKELQRFPTDCEVVDAEPTRSRRNRRYGLQYPGKRPVRKVHLGLGFDVSGSMWDPKVIGALQDEVNVILASGSELTVIFFDSVIQSTFKVTDKLDINGVHATNGGGGTDFAPVFAEATRLGLDGLIMATDGYASLQLSYNKPCIWAIYGQSAAEAFRSQAPFGKVLLIEAA